MEKNLKFIRDSVYTIRLRIRYLLASATVSQDLSPTYTLIYGSHISSIRHRGDYLKIDQTLWGL